MATHRGIRLVAGLGNPDAKYSMTRHNAGFWFADAIARKRGVQFRYQERFKGEVTQFIFEGEKIWLLKPLTFMNESGISLRAFTEFYKIPLQQILVAHDEIDLPNGSARIKWAGGHGGHNGLKSIFAHLGSEFLRLRLGVGHPGHKDDVIEYVLKKPDTGERHEVDTAIDRVAGILDELLKGDTEAAMKILHTRNLHGL
ncbi:MAG: aminoacyl-tRNA hydrolase [Gammaproteobacteria bacterium]|nr:aminoacyl-tRNA hydrolase [Gammaproteobacteria bacterium]